MAEHFDTSGHFHVMPGHPLHRFMGVNRLEWSDLSPFTQGYVEALFGDLRASILKTLDRRQYDRLHLAFSDLAAETLARIMEDCATRLRSPDCVLNTAEGGRSFWLLRQAGQRPGFPPLTPYFGDDGKVYLREGA